LAATVINGTRRSGYRLASTSRLDQFRDPDLPHQLDPCDAGVDRTKRSSDWELYFAPSTSKARSNETPDSDRMLRRRNVLSDRIADFAHWDRRILRCFRTADEKA
jgi:hypothetical protein